MYRNTYQRGLLTVLFSCGAKPLGIWDTYIKDGYITRFLDKDIKAMVIEIGGTNVSTTYITCPKGAKAVLAIKLPFLVMVVKNLKKYFSFEVTILDDSGSKRRFRISNFQSSTQIMPMCTVMPIGLSDGWNQIQFNLSDFTKRAYKKQFIEVLRLKINANIRVRRIYFAEKLIPDEELPPEYKLFFPLGTKGAKVKKPKELPVKETAVEAPAEVQKPVVIVEEPPQAPPSEATEEGPAEVPVEGEEEAGEKPPEETGEPLEETGEPLEETGEPLEETGESVKAPTEEVSTVGEGEAASTGEAPAEGEEEPIGEREPRAKEEQAAEKEVAEGEAPAEIEPLVEEAPATESPPEEAAERSPEDETLPEAAEQPT